MAASGQKWRRTLVYIVVISIWMDIHGLRCLADNKTVQTLCQVQCEALCLDHVPTCESDCSGERHWVSKCTEPVCEGSCSVLQNSFVNNQDKLPGRPNVTIAAATGRGLELSWPHTSTVANLTTIYVIEQATPISSIPGLQHYSTYKIINWVKNNRYRLTGIDACSETSYRVMAINQYGSVGFSPQTHSLGLKPGEITNIGYSGAGVYFYKDVDASKSLFMSILQWDNPTGWSSSEIQKYEWNEMAPRWCSEIEQDSLPTFHRMENQSNHILLTIAAQSLGCTFTTQVRAVSTCNVTGPWTDFKVDLTDCHKIMGYDCRDRTFDPPGQVENLTLSISATPMTYIMQLFKHPFTINPNSDSPLLINLHIQWQPPADQGSDAAIDKYIIRSGIVLRNLFPIPPDFVGTPSIKNVSKNIRELIFQLPTSNIPFEYGVQVVAVSANQVVEEEDLNVLPKYTIKVDRNDSLATLRKEGTILLNEAGIVIVYMNNTLPVGFIFDQPQGKTGNDTGFDRYALQWGPLTGPYNNQLLIENRTIVPLNQSVMFVFLQQPKKKYGIKIKYLSENDTEPEDDQWDDVPILAFNVPDQYEGDQDVSSDKQRTNRMTVVYVSVSIAAAFVVMLVILRASTRRQHFKHLERRLMLADADSDTDSQDGDHYFVMRTAGNQSGEPEESAPSVVTDRWELPHCCIKVGRVLGSGAFGQVVKGRVSRSVLHNRGIDFPGHTARSSTHITVAVKMLQECSEERYSADFLKEMQMMKSIGYHRNIVSMLGCCTLREPLCLLVEYVPHGDLQTYLRKIRHQVEQRAEEVGAYVNQEVELFTPHDLLSFARQIVTGMEYLSQKGFVHRDLAARNVLVGDNSTVKIADFGLARYIYHDVGKVYVNRHGGRLPLKWMAPESIADMTFSTASDVWSFGIVLFEIVTLGAVPYPDLSHTELLQALKQRYIMEKPHNCSQEIYEIMKTCWSYLPASRPSFSQLRETFTAMLEQDSGLQYFDFKVHEDRVYYRIDSDEMDPGDLDVDSTDGLDAMPGISSTSHDAGTGPCIVHEIPEKDCTIEEFTKKSHGEKGIASDGISSKAGYSNEAFRRNASTTSSFHNELYQDMDEDRILGLSARAVIYRGTSEGESSSTGSDEVFEDCQACDHTDLSGRPVIEAQQCHTCNKRNIHLNHLNLHVSERNDSGLGSDTLSRRYHTDSSNSSDPGSPTETLCGDAIDSNRGHPGDPGGPRRIYDQYFVNLERASDHGDEIDVTCKDDNGTNTGLSRTDFAGAKLPTSIKVLMDSLHLLEHQLLDSLIWLDDNSDVLVSAAKVLKIACSTRSRAAFNK